MIRPSPAVRVLVVAALLGGVILLAATITSGGEPAGRLRMETDDATNLIAGNAVRISGSRVGRVTSVERADGRAIVLIEIDDERVWPLPQGTTARVRFGTSVSVLNRSLELVPGKSSATLRDGAVIAGTDVVTPVEFDRLFHIVDRDVRGDIRGGIAAGSRALRGSGQDLNAGVRDTAGGLEAAAGVFGELGADPAVLSSLVREAAGAAAALRERDGDLRETLTTAAVTFDAMADRSQQIGRSLERLPASLGVARTTMRRLDRSLVGVRALVGEMRPGARRLRGIAPTVASAISTLDEVAPLASTTLGRAARTTPALDAFLQRATPFVARARSALDQATPQLACLRPFTPETAAFLATWAGHSGNYDATGHYIRATPGSTPYGDATVFNSEQLSNLFGSAAAYAFPRPAGLNVGEPLFVPECGVTEDALKPSADPETQR